MSKDKHRSRDRQLNLVARALTKQKDNRWPFGVGIHVVGGIALRNRDLQAAIKRGWMKVVRSPDGRMGHGGGIIQLTRAVATQKGANALLKRAVSIANKR